VLVNTGDGKGKSTAAFGTMLRGVARGWRVAVVQFVKSGEWHVGEQRIAEQLGVDWYSLGAGFTWDSDDLAHDIALATEAFATAAAIVRAGEHELVISGLDQATGVGPAVGGDRLIDGQVGGVPREPLAHRPPVDTDLPADPLLPGVPVA